MYMVKLWVSRSLCVLFFCTRENLVSRDDRDKGDGGEPHNEHDATTTKKRVT